MAPRKATQAVKAMVTDVVEREIGDIGPSLLHKYGKHTLLERSIPSLYDGLKPVQRRILWAMNELKLRPTAKALKAAKTVGDVMGDYHPHGDTSIFGAMVTMVNSAEPMIDGGGSNWGTITSEGAASRYVEAKLTDYSYASFFDSDMIPIVDIAWNYDDRVKEPVALPANTINLLVNGTAAGIAVGASTIIPTFTLTSVNKMLMEALKAKDKKLSAKKIASILEYSRFYGGVTEDTEDNITETLALVKEGKGRISFAPDYTIEKGKIVVTGFPSHLQSGAAFKALAANDLIARYIDETSIEDGVKLVIEPKKGVKLDEANTRKMLAPFYKATTFSIAYTTYTVSQDKDGEPVYEAAFKSGSIVDVLYEWIEWRLEMERKTIQYRITKAEAAISKYDLLLLAHKHRDVLDACRDQKDPKGYLVKSKMKVSEEGAAYLLSLTVMQLTKINLEAIKQAIADTEAAIKGWKKDLKDLHGTVAKSVKEAFK